MAIDLTQFTQTFLEESFEGLDLMESSLLELEPGDHDTINAIFRAAHSMKGGAGTFGFAAVAEFTHRVETLLDRMRAGEQPVNPAILAILLEAVDCTRHMLVATRDGDELDSAWVIRMQENLDSLLDPASAPVPTIPATSATTVVSAAPAGWRIRFRPESHILRTGNEPLRMFAALAEFGQLEVSVDTRNVPAFAEIDPESCYLAWELTLHAAVERRTIDEIFEWVEDDCELDIQPLSAVAPDEPAPAPSINQPADEPPRIEKRDRRSNDASSIRVNIDKIDTLINRVGELVIAQSMLNSISEREQDMGTQLLQQLRQALLQMQQHTRDLQEDAMRIRMLPISTVFNRLPRLVHDISQQLGKKTQLQLIGEQTELDKTVLEKIGDPLTHLVRNALDHGIEAPAKRIAAGKPATGTLLVKAFYRGGNIVIEVSDDGAGLNLNAILERARSRGLIGTEETPPADKIRDMVFHPGFSTAAKITDLSGRGVGLDVVRRNINDLGGHVEITSEIGQGTCFTIQLPLTLAILDGQLARVGDHIFTVPLISILESLQIGDRHVNRVNDREILHWREDYLPVVRLYQHFGITPRSTRLDECLLMVVEGEGHRAALVVDELLGQQQVVIKSLEANFRRVPGFSAATILGDGTVSLILDIGGLIRSANVRQRIAA